MHHEILIIGGGPAAITLTKVLGRSKDVAVIRPEDNSMIYCAMPYVIEGLLPVEKTLKKDDLITEAGGKLIRNRAAAVNTNKKEVTLESGDMLTYDKLIFATGANPVIPPVIGKDLPGVMTFKTESDLKLLKQTVEKGLEHAVIVGAGAIGIELAQALRTAGARVDLVDMAVTILSNLVDPDLSLESQDQITQMGIELHLGKTVVALHGEEQVESVELDSGKHIDLPEHGIVVFAVGMKAETDLAREAGIETGRGGIIINSHMETNLDDIYAVGDCVQFTSGITHEVIPGKLATNAVPMARVLASRLLGKQRSYAGFFNGAATKTGSLFVGGTGLSQQEAKKNGFTIVTGQSRLTTRFPIMPDSKPITCRLHVDAATKQVVGAQLVSGEPVTSTLDLLTLAIQKKMTVTDLIELSYSSQPYQSFFPAANVIVMAAEQADAKIE
jgi:NADH dehydrogenase/NADH oxidase (H2O2-forming)